MWTVFHNLENPHSTSWPDLLPVVRSRFPADVKVAPYEVWLKALQESANNTTEEDASINPAVKLLDFFEGLAEGEGMPEMCTDESVQKSATMAGLEAVKGEWVGRWMEGWEVSN